MCNLPRNNSISMCPNREQANLLSVDGGAHRQEWLGTGNGTAFRSIIADPKVTLFVL